MSFCLRYKFALQHRKVFPHMLAVLRNLVLDRSRDCSVYTTSEDGVPRRTPTLMSSTLDICPACARGAQKNRLVEMVLLSTHNIRFG